MRRIRLAGLFSLDVLTLAGALIVALWIRFDGNVPTQYYNRALDVLPLFVAGGTRYLYSRWPLQWTLAVC